MPRDLASIWGLEDMTPSVRADLVFSNQIACFETIVGKTSVDLGTIEDLFQPDKDRGRQIWGLP